MSCAPLACIRRFDGRRAAYQVERLWPPGRNALSSRNSRRSHSSSVGLPALSHRRNLRRDIASSVLTVMEKRKEQSSGRRWSDWVFGDDVVLEFEHAFAGLRGWFAGDLFVADSQENAQR